MSSLDPTSIDHEVPDLAAGDGGAGGEGVGVAPAVVCNLLGVVPQEPVVSPQGYVFEKRAIDTYLESTGNFCPVTREPLRKEDLLKIPKLGTQTPHAPHPHSIPNLVELVRNEMDTLLLENFTIRGENKSLKQELSTTLYTEDAAVRLMVQMQREVDSLKEKNQQLLEQMAGGQGMMNGQGGGMMNGRILGGNAGADGHLANGVSGVVPAHPSIRFCEEMKTLEETFRLQRREKKKKEKGDKVDYAKFDPVISLPLHSTTAKGIRCLALHPEIEEMVVTGGVDGTVIVFHVGKRKLIDQMKIQIKDPKPITSVACFGDMIVAGSLDGSVGIFRANNGEWERGFLKTSSLRYHRREVTQVTFHPSAGSSQATTNPDGSPAGDTPYFLTSSKDKSYAIVDAVSGEMVCHKKGLPAEITCSSYHPGGGMVALGRSDGCLEVQAFNDTSTAEQGPDGTTFGGVQPITMIAASELKSAAASIVCVVFNSNCTSMASASAAGEVQIWDLRKHQCLQSLHFPGEQTATASPNFKIRFDKSGKYLLVCAHMGLHLYYQESKESGFVLLRTITDHKDLVMDAGFATNMFASVSMDRELKVYEKVDL